MSQEKLNTSKIFKYNMSFYYQSTIIYFVVFTLYVIIRGEFVENSFKLITRDPIIYFFAIIVCISLISLLYNLYKNRHLEINGGSISFVTRFKTRTFSLAQITEIRVSRSKRKKKRAFKLIMIKVKDRRRPIFLRTSDYENEQDLIN